VNAELKIKASEVAAQAFFADVNHDEVWESFVSSNPFVTRIKKANLKPLFDFAAQNKTADGYLSSPTYFLMTGRKSLWVYQRDDSMVAFGWHPNVDGQVIFFPPVGPRGVDLIADIVNLPVVPSGCYSLARIPEAQSIDFAKQLNAKCPNFKFEDGEEQLLDWRYPVHTMSVDKLANPTGGDMRDFRKGLIRAQQGDFVIEDLDPVKHKHEIEILTFKWVKAHPHYPIRHRDQLAEPSRFAFELMRNPKLKVDGFMVFTKEGEPVGFNIWERPLPGMETANGITNIADTAEYRGVSELMFHEQAKRLKELGVQMLCLGGSETPSLDQYKRKLKPIESAALRTVTALLKPAVAANKLT
jgi:hypothetical protein